MRFRLYSKDQDLEETVFVAAMSWRILYGSFRIFLGYKLLSFVGQPALTAYQHFLSRTLADADDFLFRSIYHALTLHGFSITYFLAGYLLFWGILDVVLSISMLRHYMWAFSVSIVLVSLFVAYEIFRFTHTHSPVLLTFIVIDAFIAYLIYHERNRLIARRKKRLQTLREE